MLCTYEQIDPLVSNSGGRTLRGRDDSIVEKKPDRNRIRTWFVRRERGKTTSTDFPVNFARARRRTYDNIAIMFTRLVNNTRAAPTELEIRWRILTRTRRRFTTREYVRCLRSSRPTAVAKKETE